MWYKASGKMENTKDYIDFNSLQHTYPTISIENGKALKIKRKLEELFSMQHIAKIILEGQQIHIGCMKRQ